jgi:glycosyltransferase involved in cell wall biosynthesis
VHLIALVQSPDHVCCRYRLAAFRASLESAGHRLFIHLENLPVLARRWSEPKEATELASADIGIAWVPDDRWSRGKCGLKVLQYLAAGLPVVGNAVGVQTAMIRHGETGFLAETPEQWADAIGRLAHDPALRTRLGQAGRRLVEDEFSLPCGAARWLALLRSMDNARARAA